MPVFAEVAAGYGGEYVTGRSDLLDLAAWYSRRLHRLQTDNYVRSGAQIRFGLVNSYSFNAFAAVRDDIDIVGINLGLIFALDNLFMLMMSHPTILPEIGVVEATTPPIIQFSDDWATLSSGARLKIPNDPIRFDYAQHIAWIARYFIMEHEFCHLFHGHVDWLCENHHLNALGEVGASSIPNLDNLDLQTLEMDADCWAATHTLLTLFRSDPNAVFGGQRPGALSGTVNPFLRSYPQVVFAVQFAIYCLFRLFHNKPVDLSVGLLHRNDHPPAILRQFIAGATLQSRIEDNRDVFGRVSPEVFRSEAGRAVTNAEKAFLSITGIAPSGPPSPTYYQDVIHACQVAADELSENWKKLRPQLSKHKRGKSLPGDEA
jgi:hypothetical protein